MKPLTAYFFGGPQDGLEIPISSISTVLFFLPDNIEPREQFLPGCTGYKLTRYADHNVTYSFYGWHKPHYQISE